MDRSTAIKKLAKILGNTLRYRIDAGAPKQEYREAAQADLKLERPKCVALREHMEARKAALLEADAAYQGLKKAYEESKKRCDELSGIALRYRVTVGTMPGGLFFHIKAQGDSWEQVIAKLTEEKQSAA